MSRHRPEHGNELAGACHRWAALDRGVRRYLRTAWGDRDAFSSGVVIPIAHSKNSPVWMVGLAGGIVGLAWSLLQISPTSTVSPVVHGVLFVGSILLLVGSGVRGIEALGRAGIGSFTLIDPLRLWEVTPGFVTETGLDGLIKARCTHRLANGRYAGSVIEVTLATGTTQIAVAGRELARECTDFLNAVAKSSPIDDSGATEIGARAAALARGEDHGRHPMRHAPTHVPAPRHSVPGGAKAPSRRRRRRRRGHEFEAATHGPAAASGKWRGIALILGCVFVPSALLAAFVLPSTRARMREEHAYELVANSREGTVEIDAYLRDYPDGRQFAQVRTLRDHRRYKMAREKSLRSSSAAAVRRYLANPENTGHRQKAEMLIDKLKFKLARETSERDGKPAALRGYLADPEAKRHRRAAQNLIDDYYDAIVKRYRESSKSKSADKELVAGLAAVVRKARRASEPCVLVRFNGAYVARPSRPSVQLALALHRLMLIQPGESFRERSIRKREKKVLSEFTAAFVGLLGPDLVTFREAKSEETADIEFLYTVSASATELYVSRGGRFKAIDAGRAGDVREVLHRYAVNGTVVFHGRKETTEYRGRLFGGPDDVIQIPPATEGGGKYSSMLESAFDDMSKRLLKKLGLPPGAAEAKSEPKPD